MLMYKYVMCIVGRKRLQRKTFSKTPPIDLHVLFELYKGLFFSTFRIDGNKVFL